MLASTMFVLLLRPATSALHTLPAAATAPAAAFAAAAATAAPSAACLQLPQFCLPATCVTRDHGMAAVLPIPVQSCNAAGEDCRVSYATFDIKWESQIQARAGLH